MIVTVVLRHNGAVYEFDDEFDGEGWEGGPKHAAEYMYTEGNYSCDCNRSIFVGLPEMPCGNTIELVGLSFEDGTSVGFGEMTDEADRGDGGVRDGGGGVRLVLECLHPEDEQHIRRLLDAERREICCPDWVHPDTFTPLGAVVPTPTDPEPDRDQGADDGADRDELRAALLRRLNENLDRRRVRVGDGDGGGHAPAAEVLDARTVRDVPLRTGADQRPAPDPRGTRNPGFWYSYNPPPIERPAEGAELTIRLEPWQTFHDALYGPAPNATGNDDPYVTDLCALEVSW
jgi:hypothetical protein